MLPASERAALLSTLSTATQARLLHDWTYWARPNQLAPPGDWLIWLLLAGRGFGKTFAGMQWVRTEVESGRRGRLLLIGPTSADVRDVMVEHGLMKVASPQHQPVYEPSKRRITWPSTGAYATLLSAEEPERVRGGGYDGAWFDELAAWDHAQETWDMAMFTMRERDTRGRAPRIVVTTTPKPIPLVKALLKDPTCVVTRGSTYENRAWLAEDFLSRIVAKYEGTRLGRQELNAELLDDTPGALWTRVLIEQARVRVAPQMSRVVVAIDPAVTNDEDSDETGIIVAGMGMDGHGYVLEDCSLKASPHGWASAAVAAFKAHRADRIVAEVNNGGDMVEYTLRTIEPMIPYTKLHASRGKQTRAEPVGSLYEKGLVHHVGTFPTLEDQLCEWTPGMDSPDRLDALVWCFTELMLDGRAPGDLGISVGRGAPAQAYGPKTFPQQNADAFLGRTNGHHGNGFS